MRCGRCVRCGRRALRRLHAVVASPLNVRPTPTVLGVCVCLPVLLCATLSSRVSRASSRHTPAPPPAHRPPPLTTLRKRPRAQPMKLLAPSRVAPPYVADIIRQPRLVLLPAPPPTPATLPQHRHPTHSARHDAPTHTCAPHHALAHPLARPPVAPTQTRCSPPAARRCCGAAAARLAPLLTTARTAALCRTPSLLFLSRSRAVSPWAWVVAHDRLRRSTGWLAAPLPRPPPPPTCVMRSPAARGVAGNVDGGA